MPVRSYDFHASWFDRESVAPKLAELECTPHEIMAITGHESIHEVEKYTKSAAQKRLAEGVRKKLEGQN